MFIRTIAVATLLAVFGVSQPVQAQDAADKAPEKFLVRFETTAGNFTVEVYRKWAPIGADHFHKAVKEGFYNECRFFRVVPNFVVQFGINGDPEVQAKWREATIKDEPVIASNLKGYVTYAKSSLPNSRTTQLFISLTDNKRLDSLGFAPFGRVTEGMDVVEKINAEYGEQPAQGLIQSQGNKYLNGSFPNLDYIKSAKIVEQ